MMNDYFFHLDPSFRDPETARYRLLPVPYDGTACFLKGTVKGPEAVLAVADQIEHFDEELRVEAFQNGILVLPEIPPADSPEEEFQRIYETVKARELFAHGSSRFPIIIGGEHSVTPPVIRAATESVENLSILQFDAHTDLRESYLGSRYSHACAMRRSLEYTPHLVQVGIRSISAEEFADCPDRVHRVITPEMIENEFGYCIDRIVHGLTGNVYITVDVDAFDPSQAPGTGTPEPGGLTWRQVVTIIRDVCIHKNVVGADVVEVMPLGNGNIITEFLAARLISKIMAYTFRSGG